MYKVFINNRPLHMVGQEYKAKKKSLFINLEKACRQLKNGEVKKAYLLCQNPDDEWKQFKKRHKVILAAGGLVRNVKGEALLIFRKGKWDLPKGKLDENEKMKEGAKREVEEETGVQGIKLNNKIVTTWHTYKMKGKPALKKTNWYSMRTNSTEPLVPQADEDITSAVWANQRKIEDAMQNTYMAIKEVFRLEKELVSG